MNEQMNYDQERSDINNLEEVKQGDPNSHNNARQLNARSLISRKSEILRANDPSEGLDGLSDGIPDDDPSGGMTDAYPYQVTDEMIKASLASLPKAQETTETKKYTLKVNGKELELTEEELIARAQKVEAADQYLADAKRQAEAPLKPAVQAPSQKDEPQSDTVSEDDLELARVLQVGSEEDAARAIARIRQSAKQAPSTFPVDEIAAKTQDRIAFKEAAEWFMDTYKDIFQDDKLKMLALQTDDKLRADGDKRPYKERYAAIGEDIRKWMGSNPTLAKKQELKKETLQSIPQANVRSRSAVEDEDQEDNPQTVIAQMAKQRGQLRI